MLGNLCAPLVWKMLMVYLMWRREWKSWGLRKQRGLQRHWCFKIYGRRIVHEFIVCESQLFVCYSLQALVMSCEFVHVSNKFAWMTMLYTWNYICDVLQWWLCTFNLWIYLMMQWSLNVLSFAIYYITNYSVKQGTILPYACKLVHVCLFHK